MTTMCHITRLPPKHIMCKKDGEEGGGCLRSK